MSLVGREVESTAMRAAVDAAAGGGQPVIVLRGEAGIGKTGLLGVLAAQAEGRRFEVRLGRATELESDAPLALFRGAVELPVADESSPDSRWQRLATVAAALSAARPVLLILDDLHWADPASLELVDLLLRRPPRSSHLFALGIRPGEVADAAVAACRASGRDLHLFDLPPRLGGPPT